MVRDGAAGGGIAGNAVFLKHIIKVLKMSEFVFISTGYITGFSGRLFFCSEDRVAQSNESNDEDTKLNQISVCNVHRHPSFLSSGGLSLRRG